MADQLSSNNQHEVLHGRPFSLLVALLALQTCALVAASAWYTFELFTASPDSLGQALFLYALILLSTLWVAVTTWGVYRETSWSRGSAVTIQILQIAIAVGSFQGLYAQPVVGWILLVSAGTALILLLRAVRDRGAADQARSVPGE
ncbi:hypothetical protein GCM10022198_11780 [Klugiella xanthotipulae]|uniref:Uncharacterized protein n=1 Tax=Klugiella xanthotipulae TaxID=244735 RepID=A0A543I4V2_9MICO|nr:hypothetical protein [Klugiella xanthotipulae]TQM65581.1 hypothetical protein FB466_0386 [Klugiella xanthotipulae]